MCTTYKEFSLVSKVTCYQCLVLYDKTGRTDQRSALIRVAELTKDIGSAKSIDSVIYLLVRHGRTCNG